MTQLAVHLRQERGGLLGWGIGLFLFMLIVGASYATVKDSDDFDQIWDELPDAMKEVFGDVQSITSVDGYLISQATSYMPVVLGIYAVAAATKRTAGAEENGLLDHLLARPITRLAYLGALALTLSLGVSFILLASTAGAILGLAISGVEAEDLVKATGLFVDLLPISLAYASVGLMLGTFFHRRGPAMGLGLLAVLGSFAVQIVAQLVDEVDWLVWATPFGWWSRSDLYDGEPDLFYYGASLALVLVTASIAAWRWRTKDLYA